MKLNNFALCWLNHQFYYTECTGMCNVHMCICTDPVSCPALDLEVHCGSYNLPSYGESVVMHLARILGSYQDRMSSLQDCF